jgi:hypothetical protein
MYYNTFGDHATAAAGTYDIYVDHRLDIIPALPKSTRTIAYRPAPRDVEKYGWSGSTVSSWRKLQELLMPETAAV